MCSQMFQPLEGLRIREFSDDLAAQFHDINAEWLAAMYSITADDNDALCHPRRHYIDTGGVILFVEAEGLGIVGCCALHKISEHEFELTKMGVRSNARGRKAGEFLLKAIIERAKELDARLLFLFSNTRSAAAIHLYEKSGFVHDDEIRRRFGGMYERANVWMRYEGLD